MDLSSTMFLGFSGSELTGRRSLWGVSRCPGRSAPVGNSRRHGNSQRGLSLLKKGGDVFFDEKCLLDCKYGGTTHAILEESHTPSYSQLVQHVANALVCLPALGVSPTNQSKRLLVNSSVGLDLDTIDFRCARCEASKSAQPLSAISVSLSLCWALQASLHRFCRWMTAASTVNGSRTVLSRSSFRIICHHDQFMYSCPLAALGKTRRILRIWSAQRFTTQSSIVHVRCIGTKESLERSERRALPTAARASANRAGRSCDKYIYIYSPGSSK